MSSPSALVAFHAVEVGGPLRSLEDELRWLGEQARLEILAPEGGDVAPALSALPATLVRGPYAALIAPRTPGEAARAAARTRREVRWFRGRIRATSPRVALAVTSTLPAFVTAARLEGVPTVLWVGELWTGRGLLRGAFGSILLDRQARAASAVIACSEAVARRLPRSADVTTINPPIASHGGGDGPGFRRRHGIPPDAPLIAAVGSITPTRGQDVLLRAVPGLLRAHPELRCVIEGEPFPRAEDRAYSARLDRLIAALGLERSVLRTAGTEPLADLYAAAEVMVNPASSHPESFARVPLEAATAGTPSVISVVGMIGELHTDGVTALLVAPGDASALSLAIDRVLGDPELGRKLAALCAELARRVGDPRRSLAAFQAVMKPQLGL